VKTTLELPDPLFRKAKISAAQRGQTLKQFVMEAVQEKLDAKKSIASKPWMKFFGAFKKQSTELRRIDAIIEEEFERIDSDAWK